MELPVRWATHQSTSYRPPPATRHLHHLHATQPTTTHCSPPTTLTHVRYVSYSGLTNGTCTDEPEVKITIDGYGELHVVSYA